ncbi:MAG: dehydrogenase [Acidimicrobiaceae bacterium]|nr:dehydrogenase [Acidimicrobiaceae bacterium]
MVIRAGLVGMGKMGRNHARVISTTEGIKFVGIADPMGDPSGSIDDDLVFDSVDELIEKKIDLAVVACPTIEHETVALRLCEAGIHTLVEKPLAVNFESAKRITDAFEKSNLVGAVGHIERFNPAIRNMRDRIEDGELGELYQITTRRIGPFPVRIQDVGVVMDLATHDLDLTAWVGGAEYKKISAHTAYKAGREHEDLVTITAQLNNGIVTNHLVNWLSPMKERVVIATGEKGCLVADTLLADLTLFRNSDAPSPWEGISQFRGVREGDMIRFAIAKPEPLRTEFEGFRDAVNGRGGEIVSMREGLAAVIAAEAVLSSAHTGTTFIFGES